MNNLSNVNVDCTFNLSNEGFRAHAFWNFTPLETYDHTRDAVRLVAFESFVDAKSSFQ